MKACIGRDFAGEMARSHALFCFRAAYEFVCFEVSTAFEGLFVCLGGREDCGFHVVRCEECVWGLTGNGAKPGGGGRDFHLKSYA